MTKISPKELAAEVVAHLVHAGYEAYFVGGCVRDMILRRKSTDFDISTSATPDQIEKIFRRTIPVGKAYGVMIVRWKGKSFEVATFREDFGYQDGRHPGKVLFSGAKEDALRRDFTVNGLFYSPLTRKTLDWVGGRADIQKKRIRTIGEAKKRFKEDKLRILRAIRFAAVLNFKISADTWKEVKAMADQVTQVSFERIRVELVKTLTCQNAAVGFDLLYQSGVLKVLIPEVKEKNTAYVKKIFDQPAKIGAEVAFCALAELLSEPKENEIPDYKKIEKVIRRFKLSNEIFDEVMQILKGQFTLRNVKNLNMSELKRALRRKTIDNELIFLKIKCKSCNESLSDYNYLMRMKKKFSTRDLFPKPLLDGKDLMRLGVKPGPQMGKLLCELENAQLDLTIKSVSEAKKWLKKQLQTE